MLITRILVATVSHCIIQIKLSIRPSFHLILGLILSSVNPKDKSDAGIWYFNEFSTDRIECIVTLNTDHNFSFKMKLIRTVVQN